MADGDAAICQAVQRFARTYLVSSWDSTLLPDSGRPPSVLEFGFTDSVHTGA